MLYLSSSSSSCRAASTDIPDPLSPRLPIIHRLWQVFRVISVSSHSCCMYVRAGRPAFDWPYAGVHRNTSLTISSLLLQQCPACLVRLACIVFMIGGRWPSVFILSFNILVSRNPEFMSFFRTFYWSTTLIPNPQNLNLLLSWFPSLNIFSILRSHFLKQIISREYEVINVHWQNTQVTSCIRPKKQCIVICTHCSF